MERKLPIYFDDMSEFFQEQIDEEKKALGSDLLRRSKEEAYTSKYPGLAKALLIKSIREEVERIRKEHQDEEVFVVQLNQFLEALSKYDTEFLRSFRALIPANEFSEGIRTILTRELHASENFRNGKDNTIKLANEYINNVILNFALSIQNEVWEILHYKLILLFLSINDICIDNIYMYKIMGYLLYVLINNKLFYIKDLNNFL